MPPRSKCSECGARVGVGPGEPAPLHQTAGDRAECPGSGKPTDALN
jgi:hypothetical protein